MPVAERIETTRLVLRRPHSSDAEAVFSRYASDRDVTRYMAWPRHESIEQTRVFLEFSDAEWQRWPAGPYVIESRDDARLIGATGFAFETPYRASTGYVLSREAWGRGYATEAVEAMMAVAPSLGLKRIYALCHAEHVRSYRVLEKCGFTREGTLYAHCDFPNLTPGESCDVHCYGRVFR
jgi:RimJ/RimL family protein N-acetyltransferase